MTVQDIQANRDRLACFYCFKPLAGVENTITTSFGLSVIEIKNARHEVAPLIFCSGDCLYREFHLRFMDRVAQGSFGRLEPRYLKPNELPARWQGEPVALLK